MIFFPSDLVCKVAQEETGKCDTGHGSVMEGSSHCHAEVKFFNDFWNDDAHGICSHGEHHEHKECQPLDYERFLCALGTPFMELPPKQRVVT